jgi:putative oxidoreductase
MVMLGGKRLSSDREREGEHGMSSVIQNFDLTREFNILRIICGAFFIPHIYAKFFVPAALGFFVAAKFKPPATWMYAACVIEIVLAIGLIFGLFTTYVAWVAAFHLAVAAIAVYRVTGGKWLWNIGGYEYCLFWAICCVVVAMHG